MANEPKKMKAIYQRRRDLTLKCLEYAPSLIVHNPEAGMFLLVDIRATGMTSRDFAEQLYTQTGVCVLDAMPFGESANGHIRLSFTLGEDQLTEGCKRLCQFVNSRIDNRAIA
jgi:arginine:pyruvate transaminase